ncbi:unnamed protein product [Ceratitis capitata]|uniref:(Mediterranean fruit fly) hypothetical protein n=1 Tax=Ceratitis capitata TaxID=7213 RepID=A0A811UTT4_CERCA|nr:unnamed protein product [Ceratitis capitata]
MSLNKKMDVFRKSDNTNVYFNAVTEKGIQLTCSGLPEQLSSPRSVQAVVQILTLGMPNMDASLINQSPPFCSTSLAVTVINTFVQLSLLEYADAPAAPNQHSFCDRRPCLFGGPQIHPSACAFGQSRHVPMSTVGTYLGGNVVNAPQPHSIVYWGRRILIFNKA